MTRPTTAPTAERGIRRRRWWRRLLRIVVLVTLAYVVPVTVGCMNPSLPFDVLINLPDSRQVEGARVEPDRPALVVLQHGLFRSWGSMWRIERALEDHGYEVLNESYPSTRAFIEDHARRLHESIEKRLAGRDGPPPRLCFVGHSLGGLVIRAYLAREDARAADACVFIGTPQRGAAMADALHDRFLYELVLGDKAAKQLKTTDPLHRRLGPVPCPRIATIVGARGIEGGWSDLIPGDDDGRVGVAEGQLAEQTAHLRLPYGHTRLGCAERTVHAVLWFLRHGELRSR